MGIYLNPDNKGFWQAIRSKIYVNKSNLIACTNELINTEEKYICVSRPRRFGKSMALKMLAAYYSCGCDSADLFKGLKIEQDETFREHLNQYDVIFLNMQQFLIRAKNQDVTEYLEQAVMEEIREIYGDLLPQMLGGGRVRVNTFSFQNDMSTFKTKDDVLTLLIHLGYLAYDSEKREVYIPNKEIIGEFENAMSVGGWPEIIRILKASEKLLEATLSGDEKSVEEGLDLAHMEASSILMYNDENSLGCAIGLAYYSARKDYRLIREFPTGRGFADVVFLPLPSVGKPALVVELKYDKSASAAIQQIKDRKYIQALESFTGEILLVGINYDRENKNKPHSCVIEKVWK